MIVLDEQIYSAAIAAEIARWYPGKIISLKELRPESLVKDDAVDILLRAVPSPTFATINITDFWKQMKADARFCIVCVELPQSRTRELAQLLRRFLSRPEFNTKKKRMDVVALLRPTRIEFYRVNQKIETLERIPK